MSLTLTNSPTGVPLVTTISSTLKFVTAWLKAKEYTTLPPAILATPDSSSVIVTVGTTTELPELAAKVAYCEGLTTSLVMKLSTPLAFIALRSEPLAISSAVDAVTVTVSEP